MKKFLKKNFAILSILLSCLLYVVVSCAQWDWELDGGVQGIWVFCFCNLLILMVLYPILYWLINWLKKKPFDMKTALPVFLGAMSYAIFASFRDGKWEEFGLLRCCLSIFLQALIITPIAYWPCKWLDKILPKLGRKFFKNKKLSQEEGTEK